MSVVRMWETRLDPASVDAFWQAVRGAWEDLTRYDGFERAEAFSADGDQSRAVVVSHWRDRASGAAAQAWEAALDVHGARSGHAWFFTAVPDLSGSGEPT